MLADDVLGFVMSKVSFDLSTSISDLNESDSLLAYFLYGITSIPYFSVEKDFSITQSIEEIHEPKSRCMIQIETLESDQFLFLFDPTDMGDKKQWMVHLAIKQRSEKSKKIMLYPGHIVLVQEGSKLNIKIFLLQDLEGILDSSEEKEVLQSKELQEAVTGLIHKAFLLASLVGTSLVKEYEIVPSDRIQRKRKKHRRMPVLPYTVLRISKEYQGCV